MGGLGGHWEAGLNTYKPFACGIVIHPTIDGCQQLREQLGPAVASIRSVALRAHPLVLELTGKTAPKTGLEGKFSVFHAAATALLRGDGSPTAFTDEAVRDPAIMALRDKVKATSDASVHEDAVHIAVTLNDGRRIDLHVPHAIGSLKRPLSNEAITEKFVNQSSLVIGDNAASDLAAMAWALEASPDVAQISRAAAARS
jgi:2-methylcitrate dehydratase PrpD